MLINAAEPEERRMAIVEDGILSELIIETSLQELSRGNIYKAKIVNIEPSLQATFVDYGEPRHGFLPFSEIHPNYYAPTPDGEPREGRPRVQEAIKRNQEVLVQVEKEEKGNQRGRPDDLHLPCRTVLGPYARERRRRDFPQDRRGERPQAHQRNRPGLGVPEGMGLIVRTAGMEKNKTELSKDLQSLLRLWDSIQTKSGKTQAPALIYQEPDLVFRSIRDYFTPDIDEVLIDDKGVFNQAKDFFRTTMPRYQNKVKPYGEKRPLFSKYELEKQLETIYERMVPLKSGGSIVIDPTEAMVAIDVNSGRATQGRGMEDTAYQTNLEAAEEIARQLRLRDLGGLVVIDFIDMWDRKHNQEIERSLRNALKRDKARVEIGRISRFGMLELSRQRIRPAVAGGASSPVEIAGEAAW